MLDRACLGCALYLSMELDLDTANLGETDLALLRDGEAACLRVREALIAILPLEAGIAWLLTLAHPTKEAIRPFAESN